MKRLLLFICVMLGITGSTKADDSFTVDNITLPLNSEGEAVVRFSLDEGSTCSGYTFWLQLPEQLEFVTSDGTQIKSTLGDSYDGDPSLTTNINEGYLKVACVNRNSDPLNKQTGKLVTFYVKVKDGSSVNVGDVLECHMTNITISEESGAVHNAANDDFTVKIGEAVNYDVLLDENSTSNPTSFSKDQVVRVNRSISSGNWSTICLPFGMTTAQLTEAFGAGYELAAFTDYIKNADGSLTVNFTANNSALKPNTPYILKTTVDVSSFLVTMKNNFTATKAEVSKTETNEETFEDEVIYSFTGTYSAETTVPAKSLFLNNSKFYYSKGLTMMKAYRAYFYLKDVLDSYGSSSAQSRMRLSVQSGSGQSTKIDAATLFNEEDGSVYSLSGAYVGEKSSFESLPKGMYIVNGKKIIK